MMVVQQVSVAEVTDVPFFFVLNQFVFWSVS